MRQLEKNACQYEDLDLIFDRKYGTCTLLRDRSVLWEFEELNTKEIINDRQLKIFLIFNKTNDFSEDWKIYVYFNENIEENTMSLCKLQRQSNVTSFLTYDFSCKKPVKGGFKVHLEIILNNENDVGHISFCEFLYF